MREIKFRAWDRKLGRFINDDAFLVSPQHGGVMPWFDNNEAGFANKDAVLMEYTGLQDKNGKEIYEGDVVAVTICPPDVPKSFAQTYNCTVKWLSTGFVLTTGSQKIGRVDFDFTVDWENELEIIGNIYENPNLLSTSQE